MKNLVEQKTEEMERRQNFLEALDETKGAWTDKNHPDLGTEKDVDLYVRGKRESYRNRLRSLLRGNDGFSG